MTVINEKFGTRLRTDPEIMSAITFEKRAKSGEELLHLSASFLTVRLISSGYSSASTDSEHIQEPEGLRHSLRELKKIVNVVSCHPEHEAFWARGFLDGPNVGMLVLLLFWHNMAEFIKLLCLNCHTNLSKQSYLQKAKPTS